MSDLRYNKNELDHLLKYFHELTGILITLYDTENAIITSYPKDDCAFCKEMKSHPEGRKRCIKSDQISFKTSRESGRCVIYTCHAGLIEATAPIFVDGAVIGYMMLGQILNAKSHLTSQASMASIPRLTDTQILASAKIMEACISDIIYKQMISVNRRNFEKNINQYLLAHLGEDLSVDLLCEELHISRRKLYNYSNQYLQCSIGKHIKKLRIEQAKNMLRETDLPVMEISERCGFTDYNYFCRVFKKSTGVPARVYRKNHY